MKTFHLVGAFDRHNYGDILFPMIHTEFIRQAHGDEVDIKYYSVSRADLTAHGGFQTASISALYSAKLTDEDRIVVVGGEVLAADWASMVANIVHPLARYPIHGLKRLFGFRVGNSLIRKTARAAGDFPYVLDPSAMNAMVFYCSVGGTGFKSKNDQDHLNVVCRLLSEAAHVSVRDATTKRILGSKSVFADLVPDVASLMSKYFSRDVLAARDLKSSIHCANKFSLENYYSLQISRYHADGVVEGLISSIISVWRSTNSSVLLVPVGYASGHEDHLVLRKVFQRLSSEGVPSGILDSKHVLDIMAGIARSHAYVGSSLHGAITAFSFLRPVCGIQGNKVRKLAEYSATWFEDPNSCVLDGVGFAETVIDWIKNPGTSDREASLDRQQRMIEHDLNAYLFSREA